MTTDAAIALTCTALAAALVVLIVLGILRGP